jgi:hypothetical protein
MPLPWFKRLAARCRGKGHFELLHDRQRREEPYMTRYRVFRSALLSVYVHQIHRGDDSPDLHDHPWPFFHAILEGSYAEEYLDRRGRDREVTRHPGDWTLHRPGYAHRLELFHDAERRPIEVWTLVVIGPKVREWFFIGKRTRCRVPWRDYVFHAARCE